MDVNPSEPTVNLVGDQPALKPPRDCAALRPSDWPKHDLPRTEQKRERRFQAIYRQSVLNNIHKHGRSQDVEVCGVLVGNVYNDGHAPFVYVEGSISGASAAGKATQVTFTAETWEHIQREMDRNHANQKIVGWYHTHPGFGIFLSDMDLFIHENFFGEPWQLAYVYDPTSGEDGSFVWQRSAAVKESYLVEPDKRNSDPNPQRQPMATTTSPELLADLSGRLQVMETRLRWLTVAIVFLALLALALSAGLAYYVWPQVRRSMAPARATPPPTTAPVDAWTALGLEEKLAAAREAPTTQKSQDAE